MRATQNRVDRPVVLAYHEIVPAHARYVYSVSCPAFEAQLRAVQTAFAESADEISPVQITFDDGHISQYAYALPILQKFNVKAVFCVTAGWTDRESDYMSGSQLRELVGVGHRIYAHGWSHRMLTHCNPSELRMELHWAKLRLEDILGSPVEGISIPHGRWNNRVLDSCASWGYKQVYVSDSGTAALNRPELDVTGRFMVTRNVSGESLLNRLQRRSRPGGLAHLRRLTTRAAKQVLGDSLYGKVWRYLGNKEQELPQAPYPRRDPGVLQLVSSGGFYGVESMLINLAKATSREKVRTVLGVFENSQNPHLEVASRAVENGLSAEVIPCHGRLDWRAVRQIRSTAYRHGIDVIHTHGSKAAFYARLAAIGLGLPLVATYHNSSPGAGIWLKAYHLLDRIVLRGFSCVAAVSESIMQSLRASGINRRKIVVISNGVDLDSFTHSVRDAAADASGEQCYRIGVVARLIPLKGHRFLLEAIPDIVRSFPNTRFLFIGDGPELPNLERIVSSLELERSVIFAGKQEDMPRIYRSLDILVSPSLHEGMPMCLIEGLASGCAVIATAVGDVPKLIRHNETGVLVEPGNSAALKEAVITLLLDAGRRHDLAMEGQRCVSTSFSSAAMAARYCEIYARLSNPVFYGPSQLQGEASLG